MTVEGEAMTDAEYRERERGDLLRQTSESVSEVYLRHHAEALDDIVVVLGRIAEALENLVSVTPR